MNKFRHSNNIYLLFIMYVTIIILMDHCPKLMAEQINISRIERMPNKPAPYIMRDWKEVTRGYDSLIFDFDLTGEFLPLISWNTTTVNYPDHDSFILHTTVGTPHTGNGEAINILPAVISASLIGIDKSNQNGINWVLMCEEFFNKRPQENVYLNGPSTKSGNDWWYDTMPNVFFYQLYDLYPGTGDFDFQFTSVANRWLEAVRTMGGRTAPWQKPSMNYRAWSLSTMTPKTVGVKQPEAAGAIGWILYNAYVATGKDEYRIGAEWCLEFLNEFPSNPSYELQLPYGVYIAARMNAELGTNYDIEKLINWCFDTKDNVRAWGATLGNWNGYDCYGLIGEAKYTGYAFIMNGFEQAGALVPLVRYDERFARAIGKWMLNLAQATRYFYPKYLPDENQDSEEWAHVYDPDSYIAHEAFREYALGTAISPYATGDFIRNGWAETNLALYGSSHVGIFGAIIDTTNVDMVLRLDVTKTDYFQDFAFQSYLYFNPYEEYVSIELDVGSREVDLYDVVNNSYISRSATGMISVDIPGDEAIIVTLVPSDMITHYDGDKLMADEHVIDYHSGQDVVNFAPRIKSLAPTSAEVVSGGLIHIYCTAGDVDGDSLIYEWHVSGGTIQGDGPVVMWLAPDTVGLYDVECTVTDTYGNFVRATASIHVVEYINHTPVIQTINTSAHKANTNESITLYCNANDPDGDDLTYLWSTLFGTIQGEGQIVTWTAPASQGYYILNCRVEDTYGAQAHDSIGIVILDPDDIGTGVPLAYYPFSGNSDDWSGFEHHGMNYGVSLVEDRNGNSNEAYYFDGIDDFIKVTNTDLLNFTNEISVCLWMNIEDFSSSEMYPISHGNWENRWKLSISPESHTIRWTVKTSTGIKDLDSETGLTKDQYYFVVVTYDGQSMNIYVNDVLDATTEFSGAILKTDIDLTIGRVLPTNTCCNYNGILDDIRIYNYAISSEERENLYSPATRVSSDEDDGKINTFSLCQNYPNPFNMETTLQYSMKHRDRVTLVIYDIMGREVRQLLNERKSAGTYSVTWDGRDDNNNDLATGLYMCNMKAGEYKSTIKLILLK